MSVVAEKRTTIQSVDRAAALLKAVADSPTPPTVVELAETCGLNRSTAWRLLATLDRHGLVERDPTTQRYGVGYAFLRLAASTQHEPVVRRARPVLEQLALETGETASLAVVRRGELVYVDQVAAPQIVAPNWLGRRVPLHATSTGKALLACLPGEERDALLGPRLERFTRTTVTNKRELGRELDAARRSGYAMCAGELEESLFGASAAVRSENGRPLVVVSVWGPEHRVPRARLPEIGRRTKSAAEAIAELLR